MASPSAEGLIQKKKGPPLRGRAGRCLLLHDPVDVLGEPAEDPDVEGKLRTLVVRVCCGDVLDAVGPVAEPYVRRDGFCEQL